jgi:DNA-binding NarL/FixJ family response regulator
VDLLFTDVIMPGAMNGPDLVRLTKLRRPQTRILYTSVISENAIVHNGRLDAGALLLARPYRRTDLAKTLRAALDGAVSCITRFFDQSVLSRRGTRREPRPLYSIRPCVAAGASPDG